MRSSARDAAPASLDELVRLTFVLRTFAVFLTVVSLTEDDARRPGVILALLVGGFLSHASVRWWPRLGPRLRATPVLFGGDVLLSGALLLVAGPAGPFFIYTLATAMLAGVLYTRAIGAAFSALLCSAYWAAAALWDLDLTFMAVVGLPSMYFVVSLGGAQIAAANRRQALDARRLAESASAEATARERVRLARELHDSVTKTVIGVALQASSLHTHLERRHSPLTRHAHQLRSSAELAARESREALASLRDRPSPGSLPELLDATVTQIEQETGVNVGRLNLQVAGTTPAAAHAEVQRIVTEAVRNALTHAGTDRIQVGARADATTVAVFVRDEGCGFELEERAQEAVADGHYGLLGMVERGREFGGSVEVLSAPGAGTTVTVLIPRDPAAVATARPGPPGRPDLEAGGVPA